MHFNIAWTCIGQCRRRQLASLKTSEWWEGVRLRVHRSLQGRAEMQPLWCVTIRSSRGAVLGLGQRSVNQGPTSNPPRWALDQTRPSRCTSKTDKATCICKRNSWTCHKHSSISEASVPTTYHDQSLTTDFQFVFINLEEIIFFLII